VRWAYVLLLSFSGALTMAPAPTRAEAPTRDVGLPHPMIVENPPTLGTVDTGLRDASGAPIGVACATCHAPGSAVALAARKGVPEGFHGEIRVVHGNLQCASCHDPVNRSLLRLAHGEGVEMGDVMRLCGQCHGPHLRDFEKGSHGGARGYWDRTRGPSVRNSCVACHAAHAPVYPLVLPAPPPNDRFLSGAAHGAPDDSEDRTRHD
jgi:formate-dependent nitrite reductase cytochrome c552 subunit